MKKVVLMLTGFLALNVYADDNNFKSFNCEKVTEKKLCKDYQNDVKVFVNRESSFKQNRVKYFFNPQSLIEGFETPPVFNALLSDVFKNIHKENVGYFELNFSRKMIALVKDYYSKNVIPNIKNISEEKNVAFKDEIEKTDKIFNRKMEIISWLLADQSRLKNYKKYYDSNQTDNNAPIIDVCLYNEIKALEDKSIIWRTPMCKYLMKALDDNNLMETPRYKYLIK